MDEFEIVINDNLTLHMTQAPTAFDGITHDLTGGVLWGGALCLARLLTSRMLRGKRTLELGSGLGVPSLVACQLGAKRVVATDSELSTLEKLVQNAERNDFNLLEAQFLDWETGNAHYDYLADVIMASDVIYGAANIQAFIQTIDRHLEVGGILYFSTRDGRQGVNEFLHHMSQSGFVEEEQVPCHNNEARNDDEVGRLNGKHTIHIFNRDQAL
jgi:predicted nicotinamide N-methyase